MRTALVVLLAAAVLVWPPRWSAVGRLTGRRPTGPGGSARSPLIRRWSRRSGRMTAPDVLALLEGLVPALGAGLAPGEALALLARVDLAEGRAWSDELARLGARARDGRPLAPAWRALAHRHRSAELMLLAQAWALSERLGSPLAEAVGTAASLVRDRLRAERRVAAACAGARATMNLLTLLPLGGAALAAVLGLSPLALYTATPLATGCLGLGIVLLLLGRWLVRRLVRRSLRPGRVG